MNESNFTWDEYKNIINQKKHGISFEEAETVFYDEFARLIHDPDHSDEEERFILLGFSSTFRLLLVCHCYHENEQIVRIISARKANKSEQRQYRRFNRAR